MLRRKQSNQFAAVREVQADDDVLHAFGDIDVSTAPQLEQAIEEAAAGRSRLLVNLTKCHYLDSSGLAVLARARNRFGVQLTLVVKPNSNVLRVMRLVGFDRILNVVTELQTSAVAGNLNAPLEARTAPRPLAIVPQGTATLAKRDDLVWGAFGHDDHVQTSRHRDDRMTDNVSS